MSEDENAEEVLAETDKCKIVMKKDGQIQALCEGKDPIDLGQVKEEDCPGCAEAVAVGYALSYVKQENPYMANRIYEQVTREEITSEEALDKCAKILEDANKPEFVETIHVLKEMMHKPLSQLEKEAEEAEKSVST